MIRARIRMFGSRMVVLLGEPRAMRLARPASHPARTVCGDALAALESNVLDLTTASAHALLSGATYPIGIRSV